MDLGAQALYGDQLKKEWRIVDGVKGRFEHKGLVFNELAHPRHRLEAAMGYDRFRDGDVMIHSYPKSGTHFVGDIVKSILLEVNGLNCLENISGQKFFMNILEVNPRSRPENPMADLDGSPSPRLIATHLPWSHLPEGALSRSIKHIQVIRNYKDILCSGFPFLKRLVLDDDINWDRFIEHVITRKLRIFYLDPFDYLKAWYPLRNDDRILTLHYEDVKKDLLTAAVKISTFMGILLNEEQISRIVEVNTFENRVKNADESSLLFLNKGQIGSWKNQFTPAQNEAVDEWIAEGMVGLEDLHITYQ